ncbi:hypothetical protein VTK56DRAFT_6281 [Thermocarpiscus australiensis]
MAIIKATKEVFKQSLTFILCLISRQVSKALEELGYKDRILKRDQIDNADIDESEVDDDNDAFIETNDGTDTDNTDADASDMGDAGTAGITDVLGCEELSSEHSTVNPLFEPANTVNKTSQSDRDTLDGISPETSEDVGRDGVNEEASLIYDKTPIPTRRLPLPTTELPL